MRVRWRWNRWNGAFVGAIIGVFVSMMGDGTYPEENRFDGAGKIALVLGTLFGMYMGWGSGRFIEQVEDRSK